MTEKVKQKLTHEVANKVLVAFQEKYPQVVRLEQRQHRWRGAFTLRAVIELENEHGKYNKFAIGSGPTGEEAVRTCENNIARILKAHGLMPKESEVA